MKKIFCFRVLFLFLLFFIFSKNNTFALGEDCNPWTCEPCKGNEKCIQEGFGKYSCQIARKEGYDCQPFNICGECEEGLNCELAGYGFYLCIPKKADPNDYLCNPWTNKPCKEGDKCQRVDWEHYECATQLAAKKLCDGKPRECDLCVTSGNVWTALGCIPTNNLNSFAGWILGKIIFVASGIAFLLMAFGAFQIITSAGNPEKVQAGKELITSCVSGLLFIILSLFLLKLIGVDILHIPGFGE